MSDSTSSPVPSALPVLGVVAETFLYGIRNARALFIIAWFPAALLSLSNVGLEWLTLGWPPRMPQWARSDQFHPPTWLAAPTTAFWAAMIWVSILDRMRQAVPRCTLVDAAPFRLRFLRFEISVPVLLAAAILAIEYLIEGLARFVQIQLLVKAIVAYGGINTADSRLNALVTLSSITRLVLVAGSAAFFYAMTIQAIETGRAGLSEAWNKVHGNWLRLVAVVFIVYIVLLGIDESASVAINLILRNISDPLNWDVKEATLRSLLNFPIELLWLTTWPVTMGVAFKRLAGKPEMKPVESPQPN